MTPTICIDFDGCIHAYTSGWQGPTVIPDPPVPRAFEALARYVRGGYRVAVYSSRSGLPEGIDAMRAWFDRYALASDVLQKLEFPEHKPPAVLYVDDRGYQFTGANWPDLEYLSRFRPWFQLPERQDEDASDFPDEPDVVFAYQGQSFGEASALISSVVAVRRGAHILLRVWHRGGLAGELCVTTHEDALRVAYRLLATSEIAAVLESENAHHKRPNAP